MSVSYTRITLLFLQPHDTALLHTISRPWSRRRCAIKVN